MARASNVWAATDALNRVIACFTVKHECVTWLLTQKVADIRWITKYSDGTYLEDPPRIPLQLFLQEAGK